MDSPTRSRAPLLGAGLLALALSLLIQACASSADSESARLVTSSTSTLLPTTTPAVEIANTGFADIVQPILTNNCATCHNPGGPGSFRWSLQTAGDVPDAAPVMKELVSQGAMPPWPASPLSVGFHDDRSLDQTEIDAIVEWVDDGAALDVDPSTPITAVAQFLGLADVDLEVGPSEGYDGSPANLDDYRCLIYDPELTEDQWLTGYNFLPDRTEVVHHAIGYRLKADRRSKADQKDGADGLPGWQCYGSSGLGEDDFLIGWAPGQGPTTYPDNSGLRMDAGDFVVVQIHYNYAVDAPTDRSTVQFAFENIDAPLDEISVYPYVAPAEIPCSVDEVGPLCDRDAALAAAIDKYGRRGVQADLLNRICGVEPADFAHMTNGVASSSCDLPIYGFGEIVSILAHEHEIGSSFRMTLNPDRADETVLLDIPDWDFEWQFNYSPIESIVLKPGDTVRIECSWDRSKRDPNIEPAYVLWADGTNDEMCFSTIVVREP